jgi:cell wall-associated NlpC family hydrolase
MHEDIVNAARSFIGVRFHHQGRSAITGVDCLGLLVLVAEACHLRFDGLSACDHDETDYGHNPDTARLNDALVRLLSPVPSGAMQAGDVILCTLDYRPQHLAILADYANAVGELSMIHAYAPLRKVVEHRLDETWRGRIAGVYRFVGS